MLRTFDIRGAHWFASCGLLSLLLISAPAGADSCHYLGGALPGESSCPKEARPSWWNGSWATREVDSLGKRLTAFTLLKPDMTYRTTLLYDSGLKREHWGTYAIFVDPNPRKSFSLQTIPDTFDEAANIGEGVSAAMNSKRIDLNLGGALPQLTHTPKEPIRSMKGRIVYTVKGSNPKLNYTSPQAYDFQTQGDGMVRVTGPGASQALARRYK
ncbi:hypothetical protein [Rhizobium leguminosarum]|nr:hypothetical protein [Rhizobium leguminosarum]